MVNIVFLFTGMSPSQSQNFFVVIEDEIVLKTKTFTNALVYSFCCFYVFSLQFPKQAESTFNFIQRYEYLELYFVKILCISFA